MGDMSSLSSSFNLSHLTFLLDCDMGGRGAPGGIVRKVVGFSAVPG